MSKIELLENQVRELSPEELRLFSEWFAEFEADEWDKQIEADAKAGRLEHLEKEALEDYKAGRFRDL